MTSTPSSIIAAINDLNNGSRESKMLFDILDKAQTLNIDDNLRKFAATIKIENPNVIENPKTFPSHTNRNVTSDKYEIMKLIGEGNFARVHRVKKEDKFFVRKCYKDRNYPDPINEIACLLLLRGSKYIVSLDQFRIQPDGIMLYLEHGSQSLEKAVTLLHPDEIRIHFADILRGINHCHHHDVIHTDIKPENIVWFGENFKLIDFGTSVAFASTRDQTSDELGTPCYRAPEVFMSLLYDYKVDVWAVGLVLYFMVTKGQHLLLDNLKYDMIETIFSMFGLPDEKAWPEFYANFGMNRHHKYISQFHTYKEILGTHFEIVRKCLIVNPSDRVSTEELLREF